MPAKVYGEFSIELEPHFHLIQKLPADGNVFAAALLSSEKVLSFPENEVEQRYIFKDIACNNEVVPPDFARAVPGTNFSGYDLSVPVRSKDDLQDVHLTLHDAKNTNRRIKIKSETGADDTSDMLIHDNYPNRRPKSAKIIGREAIRNFLAWQLQVKSNESVSFELASEQQLATLVGQYARGERHTIRTAETHLSTSRALHAEKEEVLDPAPQSGEPVRVTHSVWLTALLGDEVLQLGKDVRARTVARLDASDIWHPGNSLSFEVEAEVPEDDAQELTQHVMMLQRNKKLQTARAFAACLGEYLREQRES